MAKAKIEISGIGGEFQHHYLNKKELKDLCKVAKSEGVDAVIDEFFYGGRVFENSNYSGIVGCSIESSYRVDGKKFEPLNFIVEQKIVDTNPYADGGNLYFIGTGAIKLDVEIDVKGKFDPKLLVIHYVEFQILDGSKSGKLISQIHYDGKEYYADFSDDGQEREHVACIYEVDKKGIKTNTNIFLRRDDEEWNFEERVVLNFLNNITGKSTLATKKSNSRKELDIDEVDYSNKEFTCRDINCIVNEYTVDEFRKLDINKELVSWKEKLESDRNGYPLLKGSYVDDELSLNYSCDKVPKNDVIYVIIYYYYSSADYRIDGDLNNKSIVKLVPVIGLLMEDDMPMDYIQSGTSKVYFECEGSSDASETMISLYLNNDLLVNCQLEKFNVAKYKNCLKKIN